MEYWHFTGNHLHVTDCSLYSWIKRHNLERESCNKPYNWKIAIRWYFTTRKSFLSKLAYWRPFIFTDWLVTRSSISVFPNGSRDLFSSTLKDLWAGHSSSKTLQWQEPKKERGDGNDNPWSFKINLILTNARYFKTCSLYKFKIQLSKVLLQSFRVFFHSFGVYI